MRVGFPLVPALVAAFSACADPTSIEPDDLYGSWIESQALQPQGSMDRIFDFDSGGSFTFRVNTYGVYGGGPTVLAAYSETTGTYRIEGDQLVPTVMRLRRIR